MRGCVLLIAIGLGSTLAGVNEGIDVAFLEEKQNKYLQTAGKESSLDGSSLLSAAAALLNIDPSIIVDSERSAKISSIVNSSPFDSAKAILGVTIAGLRQGDVLDETASVSLTGEGDLLKGLSSLRHVHTAEQIQLDTTYLPGCGEPCLEYLILEATNYLGLNASYTPGEGVLRGEWTFRGSQSPTVTFNLQEISDRLLALEVVSFWAAFRDAASENARRAQQDAEGYTAPQILTRTFISPLMVKKTHGSASEHYVIVQGVFKQLIASAQQALQTSCNGRMVTILSTMENVEDSEENDIAALTASLSTSPVTRRSLLASGDSGFLESFVAWVTMWGTFILLLFFCLAGTKCLKGMKFKHDSLLYGKNKSE